MHERKALQIFSGGSDIVIKPADKGGATVVTNKNGYLDEAKRQLKDGTFYKALPNDPTTEYKRRVSEVVERLAKRRELD